MNNDPSVLFFGGEPAGNSQKRQFKLHPAVIKTIIREQGGSLSKAIAELVMNSIDAGATSVDITTHADNEGFTIRDDGRGFQSRADIDQFFETFGTPHSSGDALFGRFRIGRGQIMSYARTSWRSAIFAMHVDLQGVDSDFGYELDTGLPDHQGCSIEARLYGPGAQQQLENALGWHEPRRKTDRYRRGELADMIRYVGVPVVLDGRQVSVVPSLDKNGGWKHDENAWYRLGREGPVLAVYNLGVFVRDIPSTAYGVSGVIVSKLALRLNAARNDLVSCPVWGCIREYLAHHFTAQLARATTLKRPEAIALMWDLVHTNSPIDPVRCVALRQLKFLTDIFGFPRSPAELIFPKNNRFTLFDGRNRRIAERVEREGVATVIDKQWLESLRMPINDDVARWLVDRLRTRMPASERHDELGRWVPTQPPKAKWTSFSELVRDYSDTSEIVRDKALPPKALVALNALRDGNNLIAHACRKRPRTLVAGLSDRAAAWTDRLTYIAIERAQLLEGNPFHLVALMVHEYTHDISTVGDHDHDPNFYAQFHQHMMGLELQVALQNVMKKQLRGLLQHHLVPTESTRGFAQCLAKHIAKLPPRRRLEG